MRGCTLATLFAAPADEAMLALTRTHIAAAGVIAAGATLLEELLVVRALEEDNQRLQGGFPAGYRRRYRGAF